MTKKCRLVCCDENDQPFLDLAQSGTAEFLITGDAGLLALAGRTKFLIAPPEAYLRVEGQE